MSKYIFVLVLIMVFFSCNAHAQSLADSGYYYLNLGDKATAADYFEKYLKDNADDNKVRMQLAYIYYDQHNYIESLHNFNYVISHSSDQSEIETSKSAIDVVKKEMLSGNSTSSSNNNTTTNSFTPSDSHSYADSGYYYLNKGDKASAKKYFEMHLKENPNDNKVRLQLGYMYYDDHQYSKSLENFNYVGSHSSDSRDVETSKSAALVIKEEMSYYAPRSLDLYFYGYYDSYQQNFISNFVGHYNYKIAPSFFTGLYFNVYTDTRSQPGLIYNDRYVEFGGFLSYYLMKNLITEFRIGYARELDINKTSVNLEGLLIYFNRIGDARIFVNNSNPNKVDFYLDMYYAGLYDYKFQNAFGQISLQEVVRFHTGGYSYMETYLDQNVEVDSRKVSYNNFAELGTGIRYHPNIPFFPVIFVEPAYRSYFYGGMKNTFTLKFGFQFIFRTPL